MGYRWRITGGLRRCFACAGGRADFVVQRAGEEGAVLRATASTLPVVPSVVAAAIRAGLGRGWRSTGPGPGFDLREPVAGGPGGPPGR